MSMASALPVHVANRLVGVAEMQALERAADTSGHTFAAMMELAGAAVAGEIVAHHAPTLPRCVVLAGPGNNGGDGLVCALRLANAQAPVRVYIWKRRTEPEHDYQQHFAQVEAAGIQAIHASDDADLSILRSWLTAADVVVDALLGTGANRPIEGDLAAILDAARSAVASGPLTAVAVDCPSGLDCDSGAVDPHTLACALTVTFAHAKHGHYKFPGAAACGEVVVADIGIDPALSEGIGTFVLTTSLVRDWLPPRPNVSHKGAFGKVMVAAGSVSYAGAAALACSAAGRAGAGLVTGAVPADIWAVVAGQRPETTWLPLPAAEGAFDASSAATLHAALAGYDALVLGCGMTTRPGARAFVEGVLRAGDLPPTVIDADGLNCLAQLDEWPALLPASTVLTPHPAELARLLKMDIAEVTARRWELTRDAAANWNAVVLAKGPYTVVAAPNGLLAVLPVATPALATAGTGDVLSGVIGALLAQGVEPFAAACLGAWLHAQSGLLCEAEIGRAGVVAGDLFSRLPRVMTSLRQAAQGNFDRCGVL